ncbi:PilZ domain-containing protein [Terasakiella sp. SH-1]|uniref:PilZ domain-containing protein n=1 Tax=Terasakiella sp. SH-1 TaxID=2560057 RepID=UPI0010732EA8|nr:PilZ domain-containing protein [Terasakiella sp. SH-1]
MGHTINMDHRQSKRHAINVMANLLCENTSHPAQVLDISKGGAKITLAASTLDKDSEVQIDLPFLNELDATVIWSSGQSCGLRFFDDQDRLNDFLYNLAIYGVCGHAE